ncbi:condensin complex subunit SMC2 [Crepidotus variabilis]|uniref:Structural maintenance of chromosomes protein n=1 Tax=Crepidotus variabilis TaxID=179855 RepID=A0A9P6EKM3_9AGAR|nr:condensin complex subunit SMC2 [Crepidotus variabilis]
MRIEELVLEGFKSYPVRTQITGWDASFNAITGLNGSGKSNILDAICFVLGITNMSQMRATNQQDLIYKRGQAGVTKASVTIVFDNSEKEKSPLGFEEYKQITVTRQIALPNVSKFLLNGHKAPQANVQTLFQSVQLNINNPNFVIMQGRITKVLNMRPPEILGMVEEAAGTRMFEDRKDKAKKTMGKKDKKMQEIKSILDEEITPKLNKLREQKRSFMAYQKSVSELEKVNRTLHAWEWQEAHRKVVERQTAIQEKEEEKQGKVALKKKSVKECEKTEKEIVAVQKQKEAEVKKGGKLKKLHDDVAELNKAAAKLKAQAEIKTSTLNEEKKKLDELKDEILQSEAALTKKRNQVEKLDVKHAKVKDTHDALEARLNSDEELLQTLLTGLSSSNAKNKGGGYMGQLADAKQKIAQGNAEEEQAKMKLTMQQNELRSLETKMKNHAKEAGENMKRVEALTKHVEEFERKVEECGWNTEKEAELEKALKQGRDNIKRLSEDRERITSRIDPYRKLTFDFQDPFPEFDRSKVKGVAATLMTLDSEHHNKATALEIAGGGKLFNVVVEDEKVGKDLIRSGLKKRVTFIPLTKIDGRSITPQKLRRAEELAPNKVRTALSLVDYGDEVAKAMAYIFGEQLICDDPDSAKRVTFDVNVKSVTLQGDVYDPSGTLSGGAAPSSSKMLIQVQDLIGIDQKLREVRQALSQAAAQEQANRDRRGTWRNLSRDLEIKQHELKLLQEQVGGSNASLTATQLEQARANIQQLQDAIQEAVSKQKEARDEVKKLERDMEEFKNNKDGKTDELKASIQKQKVVVQKDAVTLKTHQKDLQTAKLELDQAIGEIEAQQQSLIDAQAGITAMQKELSILADKVLAAEDEHRKAEELLQEEMSTLNRFDKEIRELELVIKGKKGVISDIDLWLVQVDHDIQTLNKDKTTAKNQVSKLEQLHTWIVDEKHQFGKEGTQYDFTNIDVQDLKQKCDDLVNRQAGMKKKLNPKVMNMIDSVEKRETELKKNMATVEKDKEKIEETIEELDRYKRDALQKTWEKVNADFGGIFAELLPSNFAKLQPPDGQDLMDGLEVKVRLGTVWKQSLTELSGGQRSLIALSLIMALLQFKPAPMYILDEIDAALDLSHTQHIGQLFRTRFKGSQFIVVSLKEGLFTNANVLFRARFRDGTSIVERTAQRSTSALYANGDREDEDQRNSRRRRIAAG